MSLIDDLLNEIQTALGPSMGSSLTSDSNASDIFEAYVFTLLIEAAETEGAAITYQDVFGNAATTFVFRTSPGYIFSRTRPYTHAVLVFPNKAPLEVHVGVRVVGKSGVLHECDVAVVTQLEAETCRIRDVPPRSAKILIAVECKFYSTPLQLNLGRAFIGLTADLSANQAVFASNSNSDSLEKLLSGRGRLWEHNLVPSSSVEVMRLRHKFQEVFQYFKAK